MTTNQSTWRFSDQEQVILTHLMHSFMRFLFALQVDTARSGANERARQSKVVSGAGIDLLTPDEEKVSAHRV